LKSFGELKLCATKKRLLLRQQGEMKNKPLLALQLSFVQYFLTCNSLNSLATKLYSCIAGQKILEPHTLSAPIIPAKTTKKGRLRSPVKPVVLRLLLLLLLLLLLCLLRDAITFHTLVYSSMYYIDVLIQKKSDFWRPSPLQYMELYDSWRSCYFSYLDRLMSFKVYIISNMQDFY